MECVESPGARSPRRRRRHQRRGHRARRRGARPERVLRRAGGPGCATSSASSKLIHGGLRYLEQYEFRLVAEALAEREVDAPGRAAPRAADALRHAARAAAAAGMDDSRRAFPLRLPRAPRHPAGLARGEPQRAPTAPASSRNTTRGFVYSDCWVDDARLVIANGAGAALSGRGRAHPRTRCRRRAARQRRLAGRLERDGRSDARGARAGDRQCGRPLGAERSSNDALGEQGTFGLKLVKGSHIVVPRLYDGDHAYILQNDDRRVIFVMSLRRAIHADRNDRRRA